MSYCDERGRISTRSPGFIERDGQRDAIIVRNVSIAGAMIEAASAPSEGQRLRFECEMTGGVDALVVWVVGTRCGLLFDNIVTLQADVAA